MKPSLNTKVASILHKELSYADFALFTLRNEAKVFEKAHAMNSNEFISKFEKGELGDEKKWFTWYGLALHIKDWDDTKKEITKVLRAT